MSPLLRPCSARAVLVVAGLLAAACTDPVGGSQTGHDGTETGNGACDETPTVLGSLEEATALGFTAGDVLAHAEGTFESPIVWSPPGEMVSVGPEQGEGQVTITVVHGGGEIRYVDSRPRASDDGMEGGPALAGDACRSRVEVDVELTITTSGGALAETVPAVVSSSDARVARLAASIDADALAGSLSVEATMDGWTTREVVIDGGMAAGVSWGSIGAFLTYSDGDVAGAGQPTIASWPTAETCGAGGVTLPLDTSLLAFSAADVLALAEDVEATFTWDGGAVTPLALSLDPIGDVACTSLGDGYEPAGISFPARLHLASGDERIASAIDVTVIASADAAGRLVDVQFMNQGYMLGVPSAEFASTYGISGFDVSGYDEASVTVNGTLAEGGSTGALEVLGLDIPPCIEDPSSVAPGGACEGVTATELGGGTWN